MYHNHLPPYISVYNKLEYLRQLRVEAFSNKYVFIIISTIPEEFKHDIYSDNSFPLVAEDYNWSKIEIALCHIVSLYDIDNAGSIENILDHIWSLIPLYIRDYNIFCPDYIKHSKNPVLSLLHEILINGFLPIMKESIIFSTTLPDDRYLSLDSGIVTVFQECTKINGNLMSNSNAKLHATYNYILSYPHLISNNIEEILNTIRTNKTSKFYNISTGKWLDCYVAKGMSNINVRFKIVYSRKDMKLYNYIINLLQQSSPPSLQRKIFSSDNFPAVGIN